MDTLRLTTITKAIVRLGPMTKTAGVGSTVNGLGGPSTSISLLSIVRNTRGLQTKYFFSNALRGGQMTTVIASGTMAVGMLLSALMWPLLLRNYQKKRVLAEEAHRKDTSFTSS